MFNVMAWGLALVLTGIVTAALGAVNIYYNRFVFREYEETEAVITKLKASSENVFNQMRSVTIYADYAVNETVVTGTYYTILPDKIVNVKPGDIVTIQVSPKNPKVFRIQDIEDTNEMQTTRRRSPLFTYIGAGIVILGIILIYI
ncbi:MAG: DUF3592 domain-containing protein [Ruminococcus sp.]|nr:DUF3592 domain-containing protein [Ruminococcus sp.]